MKSNILLNREAYDKKTLTIEQAYETSLKQLNSIKDYNASLATAPFKHTPNKDSLLDGIVYSLKDNIATKGITTTGGSLFLKNYVPQYDATVKTLLEDAGAVLLSKDNLDEFGLGGTGTFSAYGLVTNPLDKTRITGGSSSGSAVLVQQKIVNFAIATDTGDSIRKPASYLGIYGYKPTYGLVSRYGVYPYAPSIDHVGVLANSLEDIAIVLSYIVKKDEKDYSSVSIKDNNFYKNLKPNTKAKLCVLNESLEYMEKDEKEAFSKYLKDLEKDFSITYVDFGKELVNLIDPIYKALSYSEASTCYANLNGILFGEHEDGKDFYEMAKKSRTKYFGKQLKRRFIIGSYATLHMNFNDIYLKAKQIRTLIINRANELFKDYDALIMSGASRVAPTVKDVNGGVQYANASDDTLQIANFAGLPSLTIPAVVVNNLPLGVNITGKQKDDQNVLNIALAMLNKKGA